MDRTKRRHPTVRELLDEKTERTRTPTPNLSYAHRVTHPRPLTYPSSVKWPRALAHASSRGLCAPTARAAYRGATKRFASSAGEHGAKPSSDVPWIVRLPFYYPARVSKLSVRGQIGSALVFVPTVRLSLLVRQSSCSRQR